MGSILAGYAQVWRARMNLLGVVALVFASGLCVQFVIGLLFAGPDAPIVNGGHLVANTGHPVILNLAVLLFFWLWAVSAGVLVVIGRSRQVELGLRRLLRWTVGYAFVLSLVFAMMFAAAFVALIFVGQAGPIAAIVVVAAVAAILGRMLLVIPNWRLRQDSLLAVDEGRWWRMCGAVVLGVVILPWLAMTALQAVVSLVGTPLLASAFLAAGTVVAVAGQAGALATIYLKVVQGIEPDKVDECLLAHAGGPAKPRAVGLLAGLALLPGLVMAGAAAINPYGVPAVSEAVFDAGGQVTAVGWPDGQHPIIATADGFLDCHNATCSRHVRHAFAPVPGQLIPANSIQEITADGTILSVDASTSGRLVLQRCSRLGACSTGEIKGLFGYPRIAITAIGNGPIHIAVVDNKVSGVKVDVIRCDEPTCDKPVAMSLGELDGSLYHSSGSKDVGSRRYAVNVTPIRIAVDAQQRPSVAILTGFGGIGTRLLKCDDPKCAAVTDIRGADGGFAPATTILETFHPGAPIGEGMIVEASAEMLRCFGYCELDLLANWAARGSAPGALSFSSAGMFSVTATHPAQAGMRVTVGIGSGLSQSRYTLWQCRQTQCQDMDSMLLNLGPQAVGLWLAARSDGSVFVAEDSGELRTVVVPGGRG